MKYRFFILIALAFVVGCASAEVKPDPNAVNCGERTDYFRGTMQMTSPDGKKSYGPPRDVLVKRVVKPQAGTITEYTVHGNVARTSTFKRRALSWVFDVSDAKKSFEGTVTYAGKGWCLERWTYAISFPKGKLTGKGWMDKGTMLAEKVIFDPTGKATVRIREDLKPIDRAAHTTERLKRIGEKIKKAF